MDVIAYASIYYNKGCQQVDDFRLALFLGHCPGIEFNACVGHQGFWRSNNGIDMI
jgi:hypothetical protein